MTDRGGTLKITVSRGRCILKVGEQYFGYDDHPTYPAGLKDEIKDAHRFKKPENAMKVWFDLYRFRDADAEIRVPPKRKRFKKGRRSK